MTKALLRIRRNADAALADMGKRFTAAWKSGKSPAHVFTFERDVKRVHEDVAALIDVGLIEKTEHGRIHVPFDVIEADFELRAA